jgi:hypothetical protein
MVLMLLCEEAELGPEREMLVNNECTSDGGGGVCGGEEVKERFLFQQKLLLF